MTIGTTDAVAADLLDPLLGDCRRKNPHVDFNILIGEKAELLSRHNEIQLDLLVMYNMPAVLGLKVIEEIKLQSYVITAPDHPLATQGRNTLLLLECVAYPMALATDPATQGGSCAGS